jgi:hypothetical protein
MSNHVDEEDLERNAEELKFCERVVESDFHLAGLIRHCGNPSFLLPMCFQPRFLGSGNSAEND